ncbi:ParB N-terminal domain-containing protein [Thiorhodococcus minor]|uniref:ParB N-terminal domain-containing protein n=1 Tax=Thiorhodococcus minor TaxID=57489 RepID=A0A6M0JVT9_9GAMM|nr:ParB N-terminal domain-containing protein [Thiorhodococcus minor]NEV61652.1 ParB N-terminal domain-containing protein [Thiorhodococcus minor]
MDEHSRRGIRPHTTTPTTEIPGTPTPIPLPIDGLTLDPEIQQRAQMDDGLIAEYAETIAEWIASAPIVVYSDAHLHPGAGTSTRWVADGFHRVAALQRIGAYEVPAIRYDGTRRDALLHAIGANRAHGLRRTRADVRRAIETLLRDPEWAQWSDRRIAEQAGASDKTVAAVRRDLPRCGNSAPGGEPEQRIGADGKTYPAPPRQPAPAHQRQDAPAPEPQVQRTEPEHSADPTQERARSTSAPAPKEPTAKDAMHAAHAVTGALTALYRVDSALLASDAETLIRELHKAIERLTARVETTEGATNG